MGKLWGSLGEALWKQVHFGGSYYTNDRVFLEGQGEDFETTKTFYNIKRELLYWKKEYYNLQDIHFNAKGNRVLADVIYKDIFN